MVADKHLQPNFPGIDRTPGVCGGDARISDTRIPVWLLEGYRRDGLSDDDLLSHYPTLSLQDLRNAWAYVNAHKDEIDQCIREDAEIDQIIEESEPAGIRE